MGSYKKIGLVFSCVLSFTSQLLALSETSPKESKVEKRVLDENQVWKHEEAVINLSNLDDHYTVNNSNKVVEPDWNEIIHPIPPQQ